MRKLDVKEIHGYHAAQGLRILKPESARGAQALTGSWQRQRETQIMWHWLVETLRSNPEIAIFLTLGLGFWAGKLKFGSFSLGVVTSTLLAGVLVGQLDITISAHVKSTFFLMFLFAVGYGVGPQFFRGLKGDGVPQVLFALMQCVAVLLTAAGVGYLLGYDAGGTAGLLAGASTISAVLGVATDSINQLGLDAAGKKAMLDAMPVAYAVTYLFGTAGSAWILATLGPKILGVDIAEECRKYEAEMGGALADDPDRLSGYTTFVLRAYRLDRPGLGRAHGRRIRGQLRRPESVRRASAPGR